jgi:HK97 gp10 family phage protein
MRYRIFSRCKPRRDGHIPRRRRHSPKNNEEKVAMAQAATKLQWNGSRIEKDIRKDLNARLHAAGVLVTSRMRQNLSTPGPEASAPGAWPHAQSGRLRGAVTFEVDEANTTLRVLVAAEYAEFLEDGTKNMAARPFIQRTIDEVRPQIVKIMTTPRKSLFARAIGAVRDFLGGSSGGFTSSRE